MKKAEIIAIGSELLTPFRIDTNSLFLTRTLEEKGIVVVAKTIVGDILEDLLFVYRAAFARSDIIICSGGLGPTIDDLTKQALAEYLGVALEFHEEIWQSIVDRFAKRGLKVAETNRRQAMIPAGARILPNPLGTAPGVYMQIAGKQHVFLLPGPPFELEAMWQEQGLPLVPHERALHRTVLKVAMTSESQVDEMLRPVTDRLRNVRYTILAGAGEIEIHLLSEDSSTGESRQATAEIRSILGSRLYTESLDPLEAVVGNLLKEQGKKVSVAESCTGGLLAERITQIAGSSAYFERGVVTYSNESKTELLGVPSELIANYGAVSEQIAKEMAEGILRKSSADFGISVTGIAGPDGGSPEKPVGTVFIGMAEKNGETTVKTFSFPGNRDRVRVFSSQAALNLLRLRLLDGQ